MPKRVLVVDKAGSHASSPQLLSRGGYCVDVTHNSDSFPQLLGAPGYDLIILQERPEAESWQLCERIRRLSHIPLIVISPDASADTCVKAINAGADYFMRKPFGPLEFLARVAYLLHCNATNQPAEAGLRSVTTAETW